MTDENRTPAQDEDAMIDALLDDVAQAPVAPIDPGFMARLLDDADRFLPPPGVRTADIPARPGWRDLLVALGGWPAIGGLAAAGMAGLWIGIAPPQIVDDAVAEFVGGQIAFDLTGLGAPFGMDG